MNYLEKITSLRHVLRDLELSLDREKAENDNEWRIRYDVHLDYKRALEMRIHRIQERIKMLREALREGGLEYHRDYRHKSERTLRRMLEELEKTYDEKARELERKQEVLERESQTLKEKRKRRDLLEQELAELKRNTANQLWLYDKDFLESTQTVSARRFLKTKKKGSTDELYALEIRSRRDRKSSPEEYSDDEEDEDDP